jgi:integrase
VFHRDGEPIGKRGIRLAWQRVATAANLTGRIPHDFRRTAVRNLERAGVPRSVAMKLTGHKTESVYRRYAIVAEADLVMGVAKLAGLRERDAGRVVALRTQEA